ncbi:MAG: ABC transporter ATP-binding protein [Phycisphaerae bacterium]|nr:ABC transporter ATP-binding protein [Phycisphaerae bacterium]
MQVLRCERLCKAFDSVRALASLTLELPASGIAAIIGPNGAGKTTLINVISGFLRPDSGRCLLGEDEITRAAPHHISVLGIARTFQDLRLVRLISVLENVMLARPNQSGERLWRALGRMGVKQEERRNRADAERLLEFVGLAEKAREPAGELSYGQQKLLSLACCLATEARILLLDEPVAGVHPEMAERILGLLEQLRDSGKLIVFIEHDIGAVRKVADVVYVMDDGKLIAQGPPAEVIERPEIMEAFVA